MVEPDNVGDILLDAARLLKEGELVVFGSASLVFWLDDAPRTRDVDIWCVPSDRGDVVEALMGELSWYHDKHDAYVEVWGPETFSAPSDWRSRARELTEEAAPGVTLVVPHPHDVLLAKLERFGPSDQEHARLILASFPLTSARLDALARKTPFRDGRIGDPSRVAAFDEHLDTLRASVDAVR